MNKKDLNLVNGSDKKIFDLLTALKIPSPERVVSFGMYVTPRTQLKIDVGYRVTDEELDIIIDHAKEFKVITQGKFDEVSTEVERLRGEVVELSEAEDAK